VASAGTDAAGVGDAVRNLPEGSWI
jgi:hypothetical protein